MSARLLPRIARHGLAIGIAAAALPLTVAIALAVTSIVILETGRRAGL